MATWEDQQQDLEGQLSVPTPQVKFEASPAESFLSTPGELYPSLFATSPTNGPAMDSIDRAMTPDSYAGDDATATASTPAATPAPEGEKKPAKKRKSWGQVLPEPKTNLPPRKRAKTEDEKEQRRVERVLRNRRAAQSSRERKRQEVEALEQRNAALESALHSQQKHNMALLEELAKLRREAGVVSRGSSPLDVFQPSPVTLSTPLFQHPVNGASQTHPGMLDDFILMPEQDGTVNPASISPELSPMADSDVKALPATETTEAETVAAPAAAAAPSDVTQHPAAVLCDLQCPSVGAPPSWLAPSPTSPFLPLQMLLMASSVLISACYLTLPPNYRNSTSLSTSATTTSAAQHPARPRSTTRSPKIPTPLSASSTLRIKSLQKLLTSSPILARPLMDATMGFLRLVSEGRDDQVDELATGSPGIKGDHSRGPLMWPNGTSLPSREVLLTLLWAIRVEERKLVAQETTNVSSPSSRPGSSVLREKTQPTNQTVLLTAAKRKGDGTVGGDGKRIRLGL
ncbi:putative transcriptional activator hac1 [Rosellinia necatrix]|uniref:Putative transcriptional activator hac1 n=1 Tax=Rosellinia necatrix TaxID=77044 RepID=A0A1W2TIK4_ROSNE|nr:putative transcriptional activator hac1 [Rosellinia necatrix]